MPERSSQALTPLVVLSGLAIAATFAGWLSFGRPALDDIQFGADQALLVRDALDIQQGSPPLLGAYSKAGVHHPGPLYQWVLAVVLMLCGNDVPRAVSALALLQWSTVALVMIAVHLISRSTLVAVAAAIVLFSAPTFAIYARLLWNPSMVFPAMAAAILMALGIAHGHALLLPLLGATVTLMVHAHAATAPVAAALLATGLWWVLAPGPQAMPPIDRSRKRAMALLALTMLALWAPPLIEAVRNGGGNFGALLQLRDKSVGLHSAVEVWHTLDSMVRETNNLPGATMIAAFALAVVATGLRSATTLVRRMAVLGFYTTLSFVVSVAMVPGPIETYYLRYGMLLLAPVGAVAFSLLMTTIKKPAQRVILVMTSVTAAWFTLSHAQPWLVIPSTLTAAAVTPFPLSDIGTASALMRSGLMSAPTGVAIIQRTLAPRLSGSPCPFTSDHDVAFSVGEALAQMVGCDASLRPVRARYRVAASQAALLDGDRVVLVGRSFTLVFRPDH